MYDLALCGKAFIDNEFTQCEIAIEQGKIVDVKRSLVAAKRIEITHGFIMPAGIDAHVHFRSPGGEHKGNFLSEGIAAACGGITTVVDMPNTNPATVGPPGLKAKIKAARNCPIDYGFYAGFTKGQKPSSLEDIMPKCVGFKLFMGSSTGNLLLDTDDLIKEALLMASHWDKPVWVHAEDQPIIEASAFETKNIQDHLRARPPSAEEKAIRRILSFNDGNGIHIAHLTTQAGLELVKGTQCTSEVSPHHLLMEVFDDGNSFYKMNPPLRQNHDRMALWNGLANGEIDIIASDHAPHTKEEKEQEFHLAPSGIPGVETLLPMMIYWAKQGKVSFERLIDATSFRPAMILGLHDRGVIEEGAQADLVVFDHHEESKIDQDYLHYKCGWSPYHGQPAIFPEMVFSKGELIVKDGNFEGYKGAGKLVY